MKQTIQNELKIAMKAKDKIRLETIRGLLSEIQYAEMSKEADLDEQELIAILKREVKKRKEEIEFAEKANRGELLDKLNEEIRVVESFLPQQMNEQQLTEAINALREESPGANMGALMKLLKDRYSGQYDAKMASEIAKRVG